MAVEVSHEHAAEARDRIEASELAVSQQGRRCPRNCSAAQTSSQGSTKLNTETSIWNDVIGHSKKLHPPSARILVTQQLHG